MAQKRKDPAILAYKAVFGHEQAPMVFTDLVLFAQSETDPAIRAGRMDMIARILRQRGKDAEIPMTEPDTEA